MKFKAFSELFISYIVAIIACFILTKFKIEFIVISKLDTLFTMILTSVITFLGFLLTSISILLGLMDKKIVRKIQGEKDMWNRLIYYFMEPFISGIILTGLCFYIVYKTDIQNIIYKNDITIFLVIMCIFFTGILRLGIIMITILQNVSISNENPVNNLLTISSEEDEYNFSED